MHSHCENAKQFYILTEIGKMGIYETTVSWFSTQFNGISERILRTLINKVRALLKNAEMDDGL